MPFVRHSKIFTLAIALSLLAALTPARPVLAAGTTEVTITKYAVDGETVNAEISISYEEMRDTLPMLGDGDTHYYHQGPVFVDDPDPQVQAHLRWNQEENVETSILMEDKDFGAVRGTNLKDLCNLVGGMSQGEEITITSEDGFYKKFAYKNVYKYSSREGPIGLTWERNGDYPDAGYDYGMRLVWFADASTNPWGCHVFGNWDWHEAAEADYWYFYNGEYPTTTNFAVKNVSTIEIFSDDPPWWDINEDQECGIEDVDMIGAQWGQSGKAGWIAEDVNRDGEINILDVAMLGQQWQKSY